MKVCHICGHKAVTNQEIRKHIEATHEKKRDFACNVCEDTKFYSKRQLSLHVRGKYSIKFLKENRKNSNIEVESFLYLNFLLKLRNRSHGVQKR